MEDLKLPERAYGRRRDGRLSIVLHRSLALIGRDSVEIRSARSAAWLPALALLLAAAAGTWLVITAGGLPYWLMVVLLVYCIVATPLAVMGLVGAFFGADVVADREKGSLTFQQGFLGMGVGTRELVPFPRIARFEITIEGDEPDRWRGETDALRQFALILEKDSGKRLVVARLPVPPSQQEEAMDRMLATARGLSALSGAPVDIPEGWELREVDATTLEPTSVPRRGRKRRKKERSGSHRKR